MDELRLSYLGLLRELSGSLDRLSQLARSKADAARQDDLMALDEVLKQEQAMTLNLRGLEQRRQRLVSQLKLEGVPLSGLSQSYPPHLQDEARQAAEDLRHSYAAYRSYADMARNTLELHLHQIEAYISASGADPNPASPGYESSSRVEPPKNMKTDFRA